MELPQAPRKPLPLRRARSLDRWQHPRKDLEPQAGQCHSLPSTPLGQPPPGRASEGSRGPKSPGSPEAPEVPAEFLPSEPRPPRGPRKDKAQSRPQQGWLKTVLNFFVRPGPEETKDKASRRAKGKEGLPSPAEPEWPGQPAPRKRNHDRKAGRKRHGHRKHAGGEDSDLHQSSLPEARDPGASEPLSQATGHSQEEDFRQLDQDALIQMIVRLLREVGDQWEGEVGDLAQLLSSPPQRQGSPSEVALHNPAPSFGKKSQEKKSNVKRTFSHKKHSSEEPRRAGAAGASSPEPRRPKRPSFLYLCVGGHRPSISSSVDLEEPEVQEATPTACGGPSSCEPSAQAGSLGPGEDRQPDRASERKEFIQKIIALLQDAEEQEGEKPLGVPEPEAAVENLAPPCRKKSQEKKSSFRKAFSHKKHSSKEPKGAGAASPEPRRPKRPSYLPLCVGGHRSSISSSLDPEDLEFRESSPAEGGRVGASESPSQARGHEPEGRPLPDGACESKELIIRKLVALLQGLDGNLGQQIRRHPSLKKFFYQLPDSSLLKLAATLRRQGARSPQPRGRRAQGPYQFAFGLANKCAGSSHHAALSLMGLRYPQLPGPGAQQDNTSSETQSPD